jgi:hypothetical protein
MVPDVFLEVREAEKQLEEFVPLRGRRMFGIADQRLRNHSGVFKKLLEFLRVGRLALPAALECLLCAGINLFEEVVQTKHVPSPQIGGFKGAAGEPAGAQSWAGHLNPTLVPTC